MPDIHRARILVPLVFSACATTGATHDRAMNVCPAEPPVGMATFVADSEATAGLVGEFALVSVRTTPGLPVARETGRLTLQLTPDRERRYRPLMGAADGEREQPLTGVLRWDGYEEDDMALPPWRLRGRALVRETAQSCFDCGSSVYRIERMGDEGFWGTWTSVFAGIMLVGEDGHNHDRVEGHFCAYRVR